VKGQTDRRTDNWSVKNHFISSPLLLTTLKPRYACKVGLISIDWVSKGAGQLDDHMNSIQQSHDRMQRWLYCWWQCNAIAEFLYQLRKFAVFVTSVGRTGRKR
jgi:hypothetical protein